MSLRKRGGIWWVDVVAPNGERIRRTTGTANKALAQELHDQLKAKLWRIAHLGDKPRRTWDEAVVRWLKEQSHKTTAKEDVTKLRWLDQFLGGKELSTITRPVIDRITDAKLAQGHSNATVNRTLEVLRQPLEDGTVTISRALSSTTFPCSFMLIVALNPCPCGYRNDPRRDCHCSVPQIERYMAKISGPLLDRIDIQIEVPAVPFRELSASTPGTSSADMRSQVVAARAIQGLGMGTVMPLSQTIIGDIIPPRQRGKYQGLMGAVFGVTSVAGPLAGGVITDHPGVVPARQRRHVSRPSDELGAVVHPDRQPAGDVVLEMRRLAARRLGDRLDVVRPAPTRLENEPPDFAAADVQDLGPTVRKLAGLVRRLKGLVLRRLHDALLVRVSGKLTY